MRGSTSALILSISLLVINSVAGHNILSALAPHTSIVRAPIASAEPTSLFSKPTFKEILELRQALEAVPIAAPLLAPVVPVDASPALVNPPAAVPPAVVPEAINPADVSDPMPAPVGPPAAAAPPAVVPLAVAPAVVPPSAPVAPVQPPMVEVSVRPVAPDVLVPSLHSTSTLPPQPLVTGDDLVTVQWVETHIGALRTWVPKTYTFHFEAMSQAPLPGVGSIGMGTLTGKIGQTQTIYVVAAQATTPAVNANKAVIVAIAVGVVGFVV